MIRVIRMRIKIPPLFEYVRSKVGYDLFLLHVFYVTPLRQSMPFGWPSSRSPIGCSSSRIRWHLTKSSGSVTCEPRAPYPLRWAHFNNSPF